MKVLRFLIFIYIYLIGRSSAKFKIEKVLDSFDGKKFVS